MAKSRRRGAEGGQRAEDGGRRVRGLGWILQRAVFTFEIPSSGEGVGRAAPAPRRLGYFGLGIQGPTESGGWDSTTRLSRVGGGAADGCCCVALLRTPCDEDTPGTPVIEKNRKIEEDEARLRRERENERVARNGARPTA